MKRPRSRVEKESHLTRVAKWPSEIHEVAARIATGSIRKRRSAAPDGVRHFKQARSERTYHALLAAATEVFGKVGYDAAQTPDIARKAGLSTGAFYRYFDDKHQAFLEVVRLRLDAALADVLAELRPERFMAVDARGAIDLVLDVLFAHLRKGAPIDRVFLAMSMRDPAVAALRERSEALGIEVLTRMIDEIIPRSVVPYPRAAALVIHSAALEVASGRAGISPSRGPGLSDAHVREALREMIHRYLYPTR